MMELNKELQAFTAEASYVDWYYIDDYYASYLVGACESYEMICTEIK